LGRGRRNWDLEGRTERETRGGKVKKRKRVEVK